MTAVFDKDHLGIVEFFPDKFDIEFPVHRRVLSALNDFDLGGRARQIRDFIVPRVQCLDPFQGHCFDLQRISFHEFQILPVG